jgi:hypothetical protein
MTGLWLGGAGMIGGDTVMLFLPQMMQILGLDWASLPIIWDADFLYGRRDATGMDSYVLCEINVSSCFAIPEEAPAAIAKLALTRCRSLPRS